MKTDLTTIPYALKQANGNIYPLPACNNSVDALWALQDAEDGFHDSEWLSGMDILPPAGASFRLIVYRVLPEPEPFAPPECLTRPLWPFQVLSWCVRPGLGWAVLVAAAMALLGRRVIGL